MSRPQEDAVRAAFAFVADVFVQPVFQECGGIAGIGGIFPQEILCRLSEIVLPHTSCVLRAYQFCKLVSGECFFFLPFLLLVWH